MKNSKRRGVLLLMLSFLCLGIFTGINMDDKKETQIAEAATTPKYLILTNVYCTTITTYPFMISKTDTIQYTQDSFLFDYFTIYFYSNSYSGESTASDNKVFNISYLTIEANIKQSNNPIDSSATFEHQRYALYNITTSTMVSSGELSGTGVRTLVSRSLPDGEYEFEYNCGGKRFLGSNGCGIIYYFSIHSTPPTYTLKAGGSTISSGSYTSSTITFTASDPLFQYIYYKKPGSITYSATSSSSYTVSATSTNNGWWYFYATDTAGNASATVSVCLDTVAPTGQFNTSSSGTAITNAYTNQAFTFFSNDNCGTRYIQYKTPTMTEYSIYYGTFFSPTLTCGLYTFRSYDYAGQMSPVYTIYYDNVKPTGTLYAGSSVVSSGYITGESSIKFLAADSHSGVQSIYVRTPKTSGYALYSNETQFFENGLYYFYCVDYAGNISDTYTITLNSTAPTLTCTGATFGSMTNKSFTVTAKDDYGSATLYYQYESEGWKTAVSQSYTVLLTAKDGKYSFYAVNEYGKSTSVYTVTLCAAVPEGRVVNSTTDKSVYFTWDNDKWTATLDGSAYTKNSWIRSEGNHVIELINPLNIKTTYNFAIDHNFVFIENIPPTCTEQGYSKYVCSTCSQEYKENYKAVLGHQFTERNSPSTCTESAKIIYICSICSYEYFTETESPSGHSFNSSLVKTSNCTENGERHHTCEKCGYEYSSEIPSFGHEYEITDENKSDGKTFRTYTCKTCGHSYADDLGNQFEKVTSYVEYLFNQYAPYMGWVFLGTAGVWSIAMGVMIILAQKHEEKEKAKRMLINYGIGMVVIFIILIACPYLVKGIAALVT